MTRSAVFTDRAGVPLTITVHGIAELAGVHPSAVYAAIKEGRFPLRPLEGFKRKIYSRAEVLRWLNGEEAGQ